MYNGTIQWDYHVDEATCAGGRWGPSGNRGTGSLASRFIRRRSEIAYTGIESHSQTDLQLLPGSVLLLGKCRERRDRTEK